MKKLKKLAINKVTLRDLDEPMLQEMAGGALTKLTCNGTCPSDTCKACPSVPAKLTCCIKCPCPPQ